MPSCFLQSVEADDAGRGMVGVLTRFKDMAEVSMKQKRENEMLKKASDKSSNLNSIANEKNAQVLQLEVELVNEREKNSELQEKLKDGDRPLKRKVAQLDKNLEQLTVMYHKLVSQNSGLKVECQVNEKKVARKEARIQQLEKNLRDAKSKYEKLLTQCANLTAAMDLMGRTKTSVVRRPVNIVRPLRGGSYHGADGRGGNRVSGGEDAGENERTSSND